MRAARMNNEYGEKDTRVTIVRKIQNIYPNNTRDVYIFIRCPLTWDR